MNPTFARYLKVTVVVGGLYALVSGGLAWWTTSAYRPGQPPDASRVGFVVEPMSVRTSDGLTLRGWYADGTDAAPAVALFHGHRSTRQECLPIARALTLHGYSLLMLDMRGTGESDGNVQTLGAKEYMDVIAGVRYLQEQKSFPMKRIGIVGIGSGASASVLAVDSVKGVGAMALVAPYATLEDSFDIRCRQTLGFGVNGVGAVFLEVLSMRIGKSPFLVRPVDMMAKLSPCPVYIFGAANDPEVPASTIQQLYDRAQEPKEMYVVPNITREFLTDLSNSDMRKRLIDFFDNYLR